MQGIIRDTWTIELSDWMDLTSSYEVYRDIEMGVKAGERYIVKDNSGQLIGMLKYCRKFGLRLSFLNVLSKN